jgi:hypothetical protein
MERSDASRARFSLGRGRTGQGTLFQQHPGVVERKAAFLGMKYACDVVSEWLIAGEGQQLSDDL